jgi:outer membrane protein assembly factor BamD
MKNWLLPLVLAASMCQPGSLAAALIWKQGQGWSIEGRENDASARTAVDQLNAAENLENSGETKRALAGYRALVKKFPSAEAAPKAQLKIARLLEKSGDPNRAFDAYATYLNKYPQGEDFDAAVEAQFNIAKSFLESDQKKILGVPTGSTMPRAQQMFESIVKSAPFSKYAALSQFNIGRALEKQGNDGEAVAAYQTVLSKYPSDPVAADAQYQIGYVHLKQMRAGSNDPKAAARSREAFEDFMARHPSSEKAPQAREYLNSLSGSETRNALSIAKFYDKQKNYKAAVIYYNEVIRQQPGSPNSQLAKARIEELKNLVGEDALRSAPEKTETGERAASRRKIQSQVQTAARPDYVGPPMAADEKPEQEPKPRIAPAEVAPLPGTEPALPSQ